MKRIYFDDMKDKIWIGILILSIICLTIGIFEFIAFSKQEMNQYLLITVLLLQILYFSKLFWYKNTVQWNKKGIVIRIKSFLGKSLRFDEINGTEFNGQVLTLTKTDGNKVVIDLTDIVESDAQKLNEIMVENTVSSAL